MKQAYKALGNTSNLAHVTDVIKKEFEEDVKLKEYDIEKYDDLSKLMDEAFQDELKLKKVLDLIGLRLVKKERWTEIVDVSSNKPLGSAFNEAQLRDILKSLAAKQFGVVDDEASEV